MMNKQVLFGMDSTALDQTTKVHHLGFLLGNIMIAEFSLPTKH